LVAAWADRRLRIAICAAIFLVGLLLRVTLVMVWQTYKESSRRFEPVNIARSLYRTGTYADPFPEPTGPTAHSPPFHPFLLSLLYHLLGDNHSAEVLKRCLSSAVSSLAFALLLLLARPFGVLVMAGVLAGLTGAFSPMSFDIETSGNFETPWVALGLMLLACITLRHHQAGCERASTALWHGLAWGLALYISPAFLPVLLSFLLLGVVWRPSARALVLRHALLTVAVAALVTVPWTVRNHARLGAWIPFRSNFPLEFFISNNDEARAGFEENFGSGPFKRLHPSQNPAETQRMRQLGEAAYNQALIGQAMNWVRAHPQRFLALTAQRVLAFWFPVSRTPAKTVVFWCLPPLALLGLWRLARSAPLAAWHLASLLIFYPLPYYVIQISHRYRYPLDWVLLLLTAHAILSSRPGRFLLERAAAGQARSAGAHAACTRAPGGMLVTQDRSSLPEWRARTTRRPGWLEEFRKRRAGLARASPGRGLRWARCLFGARRQHAIIRTASERSASDSATGGGSYGPDKLRRRCLTWNG
jgi:4-amino-4-deoxy-L-arabinose transferase-like glycosyltransferase